MLKLLAKIADDRYQSATGLKRDLEECRRQWEAGTTIAAFDLDDVLKHVDVVFDRLSALMTRKEEPVHA